MEGRSLAAHFAGLDDPRVERTKKHSLGAILLIALCAVICGADSWVEVEQFGRAKLVKLHFEGETTPDDLAQFGEVANREGPVAELKVDRWRVAEALAAILDRHTIVDMSVQDPPLDQVIAKVFEEGRAKHEAGQPVA